jgi:DNA-binding response OmpR family regulator
MEPLELYKGRILVVEDSAELLEMMEFVLRIHNYQVVSKNHADDIYDFVLNNNIDLLLLDVNLNDENGRDICKKLKADTETGYFPVILMSADAKSLHDFGECKADDIIEKPFGLNVLLAKINAVISNWK